MGGGEKAKGGTLSQRLWLPGPHPQGPASKLAHLSPSPAQTVAAHLHLPSLCYSWVAPTLGMAASFPSMCPAGTAGPSHGLVSLLGWAST